MFSETLRNLPLNSLPIFKEGRAEKLANGSFAKSYTGYKMRMSKNTDDKVFLEMFVNGGKEVYLEPFSQAIILANADRKLVNKFLKDLKTTFPNEDFPDEYEELE